MSSFFPDAAFNVVDAQNIVKRIASAACLNSLITLVFLFLQTYTVVRFSVNLIDKRVVFSIISDETVDFVDEMRRIFHFRKRKKTTFDEDCLCVIAYRLASSQ